MQVLRLCPTTVESASPGSDPAFHVWCKSPELFWPTSECEKYCLDQGGQVGLLSMVLVSGVYFLNVPVLWLILERCAFCCKYATLMSLELNLILNRASNT